MFKRIIFISFLLFDIVLAVKSSIQSDQTVPESNTDDILGDVDIDDLIENDDDDDDESDENQLVPSSSKNQKQKSIIRPIDNTRTNNGNKNILAPIRDVTPFMRDSRRPSIGIRTVSIQITHFFAIGSLFLIYSI